MATVKATFDGHVFVPQGPVDLPVGFELEIPLQDSPPQKTARNKGSLARLAERLKQLPDNPDLPSDLAEQHDHYLYGTPRRE
jgi:hypothetical protein